LKKSGAQEDRISGVLVDFVEETQMPADGDATWLWAQVRESNA
jgi:hypothetical protein